MSQQISQVIGNAIKAKLKEISVGQAHNFDVSACFAPTVDEHGQLNGFGHSWLVTVSIPNPLLGQPDIAVSLPVEGVVPPTPIFERVAEALFQKCMEQKDRATNVPVGMDLSGIGVQK